MTKALRDWLCAAAGLFALSGVALAFFLLSPVGFVHITALFWLFYLCGLHLLITLTVWLCRNRRWWAKTLLVIACVVCSLVTTLIFGGIALQASFYRTGTSTLHRPYTISESPGGTNRLITYKSEGHFESTIITAAPMLNGWLYHRPQQHRDSRVNRLEIEWENEHRAVVQLWEVCWCGTYDDRLIGSITVAFD